MPEGVSYSLGAGVRQLCAPQHRHWERNLGLLQEQHAALTVEPSLQSHGLGSLASYQDFVQIESRTHVL